MSGSNPQRILRALGVALEARGLEPFGHTDRVAQLAVSVARTLGLPDTEIEAIRLGAYLHDLGKFGVPHHIAIETGPLEPAEWALMRRHTRMGLEYAGTIPDLSPTALALIAHHHERWDGSGYPQGLAGEAIPEAARILAVVDAFVAMTADWWHGRAIGLNAAMYQLSLERGETFEPRIVDALAAVLELDTVNHDNLKGRRPTPRPPFHPDEAAQLEPLSETFAILDRDMHLLYATPAVYARMGLEPGKTRAVGLEFVHPDDRVKLAIPLVEMLSSGRRIEALEARAGSERAGWAAMRFEPSHIPDADGDSGLIFVWFEDVSIEKHRQTQAKQMIRRMSLVSQAVASSNAAILITDAEERIVDASPAFLRQTGYSLEEVVGRTPRMLQGPNTSRTALRVLSDGILAAKPCQTELLNYRKDGSEFWVQINIDPVLNAEGRPVYFVSVQQDITDLKLAQQEETRLLEISQDAIIVTDLEGRWIRSNPNGLNVLAQGGNSPENIIDCLSENDLHAVDHALELAQHGETTSLETRGHSERGWNRWITWNLTPFTSEDRLYWVGRDITDRKLAALTLKRERDFITSVVETAASLVLVLDRQGRIVQFNRACERITGQGFSEVRSQPFWAILDPAEPKLEEIQGFFVGDSPLLPNELELRVRGAEGQTRIVAFSNTVLASDRGLPEFIVVTGIDITDRQRAEEALRESEHRHRQLFIASERQRRELELLDRVRTALARELDRPSIARVVLETMRETFGYELLNIYRLDSEQWTLKHSVGYERIFTDLPLGAGILNHVLESQVGLLIEDTGQHADFVALQDGIVSSLSVPLTDQGSVIGVLTVESTHAPLTPADLETVEAVAEHLNLAFERARYHGEVLNSERQYREVVERINDAIVETEVAGEISFVNPAWIVLTGHGAEESKGRSVLEFIHPDDHERLLPVFSPDGPDANRLELRLLTEDGRFRWVSLGTHRSRGRGGKPGPRSMVFTDINDLRADAVQAKLQRGEHPASYTATDLQRALEALIVFLGAQDGFVQSIPEPMTISTSADAALEAIGHTLSGGEDWDEQRGTVLELHDQAHHLIGRLGVRWAERSHHTERITLREFVDGFTAALERAKAHAAHLENERASREFLEAILWAQEGERERIALGLHDGPAQSMISAMRYVESTMALPEADEMPVQNHLERSVELIADAVRQMREVITDLIPPDLEVMGLGGAIHQHLERSANEAHWMIETQLAKVSLPRESEVALYRIFVESLNNVRRHANAKRVSVKLEQHGDEVLLHVQDDGIGFEPSASDMRNTGSIGTLGMRKRAELIGGQFHIESQPGAGTSVRIAVPARSLHEPVG